MPTTSKLHLTLDNFVGPLRQSHWTCRFAGERELGVLNKPIDHADHIRFDQRSVPTLIKQAPAPSKVVNGPRNGINVQSIDVLDLQSQREWGWVGLRIEWQ